MTLKILGETFTIFHLNSIAEIPTDSSYLFIGKTEEELSVVCPTISVPDSVSVRDDHWRAFQVQGPLGFSLTGILSKIATVLAENGIPIFAVSTYNTDYILVKSQNLEKSIQALRAAGYQLNSESYR